MVANSHTGKVTVFTVIWFIILLLCGLGTSNLIHTQNPIVGFAVFVVGFSVPIVVYRSIWMIKGRFNFLPKCRNKRCNTRKYRIERQGREGTYYSCQCGDLYLLVQDQFRFVASNCKVQPYRQRINGQWWPAPELFEKYSRTKD